MSVNVCLCIFRIEICDEYMNLESENCSAHCGAMAAENDKARIMRGRREMRDITIETYSNGKDGSSKLLPPGPKSKEKKNQNPTSAKSKEGDSKMRRSCEPEGAEASYKPRDQISFISGNPFVEVTKGILHLFKEDEHTSMERASHRSQTVCLLAVPATMTCHDLLTFTAACHADIQHLRIVRDGVPNQYMALITFRTQQAAAEFYSTFNGAPYNSLEPECCCHLVFVSRVEVVKEDGGIPPAGHTELPTCPVCLERMDESVDGVLTILCNHTFHSACLAKWGDTSCPVCRYVQTPELVADNRCLECHSADSLWICLICGHVGCGRYVQGHAFQHYLSTQHCYSMQLGNNRVWDYVGDNFVHRLLQNKGDGKLVEGSAPSKEPQAEDKIDAVQLEFTYLLTSQLDSQRLYFEELLSRMEQQLVLETAELKEESKKLSQENEQLSAKIVQLTKEKQTTDKKLQQVSGRLAAAQSELHDERQMSRALRHNQTEWQAKFSSLENQFSEYRKAKDKELADVKEQLQDVMFFLEAQKQIEASADRDEIAEGRIVIGEAPQPTNTRNGRRRRKNR